MIRINIVPLSVNKSYKGRKFATPELDKYKLDLSLIIPKTFVPEGKLSVRYHFGVSSEKSDLDNLIKSFQDCLAKRLGFNDKMIYEIHAKKTNVSKGKEFIEFELSPETLDTE